MKKFFQQLFVMLSIILLCLSLIACTDNSAEKGNKSFSLNYTSITIEVGESFVLHATTDSNDPIKWETSNFAFASVYNGKVTAKKSGTVTITATQGKSKATCTVVIKESSIRLNYSSLNLTVGEYILLIVDSKSDANVRWRSSNISVATVSAVGMVSARKAGTAIITATQGNLTVTCTVTVK